MKKISKMILPIIVSGGCVTSASIATPETKATSLNGNVENINYYSEAFKLEDDGQKIIYPNDSVNVFKTFNRIKIAKSFNLDLIGNRNQMNSNYSNLFPTGIFLPKGKEIEVELKTRNKNNTVKLVFALPGEKNGFKTTNSFESTWLEANQKIKIKTDWDTIVYIKSSSRDEAIVDVHKNKDTIDIPVFNPNQINEKDFWRQYINTSAPFMQFIGKRFIANFPTKRIVGIYKSHKKPYLLTTLLEKWSEIGDFYSKSIGLSPYYYGIANGPIGRMLIDTHDNLTRESAYTNDKYISIQNNRWLYDLFDFSDNGEIWGQRILPHEIGHMYQNLNFTKRYSLEFTNRMLQQLWKFKKSNGEAVSQFENWVSWVESMFEGKEKLRHNEEGIILLFAQLIKGFGSNFLPTLHQYYRTTYNNKELYRLNDENEDELVIATSKVTNTNLESFFKKWGFKLKQSTLKTIRQFKPLSKPIWKNYLYEYTEKFLVEKELPKYQPIAAYNPFLYTANNSIRLLQGETKEDAIERYFIKNNLSILPKSNIKWKYFRNDSQKPIGQDISIVIYDSKNVYSTINRYFLKLVK